ncbi:hypothetical protein K450DRAFT_221380 [Umbelopsis ramanniana AG]|uniref:Uncharacterized protein n=1 Tax=Umbelopsis ramanniana AG TaxID=1314678 RepID=A0AAD5EHP8_UMBRA|nr:uncharacterized protein K450DRAFT_221380 [Umbelopsis ramanniana AG]KAI8584076.1 hypothetical protein K450DRAFT_221380 [Umbelopsis ramanniana AG]
MEFEELSKIIKSGKVVGTNSSSTSLELADPAPSYENFRNTIYHYPSVPHRSWTDYPSGPGISKRRRPVPGVSRFVNSVRKLRKDSSSRLTKPFEEVMSSEDDVSDSDRNYKLSSTFNDASDISFNTALMMDGPPKDQYVPLSKPKFSRSSSKSSIIAIPETETREQILQRPDRLRGLRSKSHNSIRDGRPPRIWRKKLSSSPKNAGSALGIQFNNTVTEEESMGFNQAPDQHETMINIRAAMNNMSNILGHQTPTSPIAVQETAAKL